MKKALLAPSWVGDPAIQLFLKPFDMLLELNNPRSRMQGPYQAHPKTPRERRRRRCLSAASGLDAGREPAAPRQLLAGRCTI